jgi:hypothetical protein
VPQINALNVFPVPDGDTGSNMLLSMRAAVQEADKGNDDLAETARAMAQGALRGARGNSGIILAQFWLGLAQGLWGGKATFDTLKYLQRGGRIGAAKVFLGSLLQINPLITLQDGLVAPAGRTRSRAKALSALQEFVEDYASIEELAVGNAACPADAEALIERLGAIFPKERIHRSNTTPVIGAHTGPGLLVVSVMGDRIKQ